MSVSVKFFKITEDAACLKKDVTSEGKLLATKTVTVKGPCSVLSPVISLRWDSTVADANYMQIDDDDFGHRYYFLSPPVLAPGKRMRFTGSVDVLMSWQGQISALSPIVARNESLPSEGRRMIGDGMRPAYCDSMTDITIIGDSTFGGNSYVMLVAGGIKNDS